MRPDADEAWSLTTHDLRPSTVLCPPHVQPLHRSTKLAAVLIYRTVHAASAAASVRSALRTVGTPLTSPPTDI